MRQHPGVHEGEQSWLLVIGPTDPQLIALMQGLSMHGFTLTHVEDYRELGAYGQAEGPTGIVVAMRSPSNQDFMLVGDAIRMYYGSCPWILVTEHYQLETRMEAFLNGATACLSWAYTTQTLVDEVMQVVGSAQAFKLGFSADFGTVKLDELVELAAQRVSDNLKPKRHGLPAAQHSGLDVRLGEGRRVAEAMAGFVERISSLVLDTQQHTDMDVDVAPVAHETNLSIHPEETKVESSYLSGVRVLLGLTLSSRADELAQTLRAMGATVAIVDAQGRELSYVQELDPDVILVDASDFEHPSFRLVSEIRHHPRLRWGAVLVIDTALMRLGVSTQVDNLLPQIIELLEDERALEAALKRDKVLHTHIENTGPGRMIRAMSEAGGVWTAEVMHADALYAVTIYDRLIVNSLVKRRSEPRVLRDGIAALSDFLDLSQGSVVLRRAESANEINLAMPIDEALASATAMLLEQYEIDRQLIGSADAAIHEWHPEATASSDAERSPLISEMRRRDGKPVVEPVEQARAMAVGQSHALHGATLPGLNAIAGNAPHTTLSTPHASTAQSAGNHAPSSTPSADATQAYLDRALFARSDTGTLPTIQHIAEVERLDRPFTQSFGDIREEKALKVNPLSTHQTKPFPVNVRALAEEETRLASAFIAQTDAPSVGGEAPEQALAPIPAPPTHLEAFDDADDFWFQPSFLKTHNKTQLYLAGTVLLLSLYIVWMWVSR